MHFSMDHAMWKLPLPEFFERNFLVRLKAEAVLYASRGVDVSIIAEMVNRSVRMVQNMQSTSFAGSMRDAISASSRCPGRGLNSIMP